jgi:hypothetical protein
MRPRPNAIYFLKDGFRPRYRSRGARCGQALKRSALWEGGRTQLWLAVLILQRVVQGLDLCFERSDLFVQRPGAIGNGIRFLGKPGHDCKI